MELFQICKTQHKDDLSGSNACQNGGRWNSTGRNVLYTAQNRALAMAELLVHLSADQMADEYVMVVLFVPDEVFVQPVDKTRLPVHWPDDPHITQVIGDEWLRTKQSLLLRVPSVVVNNDYNVLINPAHPAMNAVRIVAYEPFSFDARLCK